MKKRFKIIGQWFKANPEVWFLLFFAYYFPAFFLENQYLTPKWWVYTPLDDLIPCVEYFIIPYILWYFVFAGSLLFFLFKDKQAFRNLCFVMFGSLTAATIIFLILPNGVRNGVGEPFYFDSGRQNFFVDWVMWIKSTSNPWTCFPSIHCAVAISVDFIVQRSAFFKRRFVWRGLSFLFAVSVCLSTVFLKQHSVLDIFISLAICLLLNLISIWWGWHREAARERATLLAGERLP